VHSVPNTEALGTISFFLGFFVVVLVTFGLVRCVYFLVFVVGILDFCDVPTSAFLFPFLLS
jgi:hypothetical protein